MSTFLTVVLAVTGMVLATRDPRRLLPGVLLTIAGTSLLLSIVDLLVGTGAMLIPIPDRIRDITWALLLLLVPVLAGVGLGCALVANGIVMMRREGRSLANRLSLLAGVGVLGVLAAGIIVALSGWIEAAIGLFLLIGPVGYVGMGFVAYLCWSAVYARLARRAPAPSAVIALGSGLRPDGSVPPLLAQRVRSGVTTLQRFPDAVLVLSGGQGDDEPRSEAAAMREFAASIGAPSERLLVESASRTTEQNLTLTRDLLADRGITGPVLAVTSDYHAFRAATLLRTLGITGHAIGARTARYYLPSALLREYLALLRDHRLLNTIALATLMAPLLTFMFVSITPF
ncbi:YdcF family protein [Microbacterium sp. ANT_H45B]|uniref:YdcF family protein n=1 Tax=Microbacterium sp. ANT_H45B TaxID=2597346 RepID=UPI0011ED198F|nr:YdcF family protein [Microbacterium sp. ANT_H45B]KAA0961804.1 YdcF family protein [Microbacterium sp. ANT_H45B]